MKQLLNLQKLNTASFFTRPTLQQVVNISDNSLYTDIKRWIKTNKIIQLKRGVYVTSDYYKLLPEKDAYKEFIANKLKIPSYLSLEYVLQKYSMLAESVFAFTSVSLKKTDSYTNSLGLFTYSNISEKLFTGYNILKIGAYQIKEATKAKSLFDYLYLKFLKSPEISKEDVILLRLNLDEFDDFDEFKSYTRLTGMKKYTKLVKILQEIKDAS